MLTLKIAIAVIVFLVLILVDLYNPLISSGILMFFFLFGALTFDYSPIQALFYPIGLLFYMAVRANFKAEGKSFSTNASQADINGSEPGGLISGFQYHLFSIIVGTFMLVIMYMIFASQGAFLGVAQLATASGGFQQWITLQFAPATSLALAFIENRMFIALLMLLIMLREPISGLFEAIATPIFGNPITAPITANLIQLIPVIAMVIPIALASLGFGIFHMVAYAMDWGKILAAALIMAMWIGSYYLTNEDTTAMDTAHGTWNGFLTAQKTMSFAI